MWIYLQQNWNNWCSREWFFSEWQLSIVAYQVTFRFVLNGEKDESHMTWRGLSFQVFLALLDLFWKGKEVSSLA